MRSLLLFTVRHVKAQLSKSTAVLVLYFSHNCICSYIRATRRFSLSSQTQNCFHRKLRDHRSIPPYSTKYTTSETLAIHQDLSDDLWRADFVHHLLPLLFGSWHKLTHYLQGELKLPQTPTPWGEEWTGLKMKGTDDTLRTWGAGRWWRVQVMRLALVSSRYVLFGFSSLWRNCWEFI